ncbi:MAG: glutamyl-tRNA reductase [Nitrososphaerales archaeon]
MNIICLSFSHKKAKMNELESVRVKDKESFYKSISKIDEIIECVLIQTCTRIEVYALVNDEKDGINIVLDMLLLNAQDEIKDRLSQKFTIYSGEQAITHLLRLSCGLESLAIGEPQILAQVKESFILAKKLGNAKSYMEDLFFFAIRAGKRARNETKIGKGFISVAKMAVELAEKELSSLRGKRIALLGAGEMGIAVAKTLAKYDASIIVINRTYETGLSLAEKIGGIAVPYERFSEEIARSDALICATSAPHYIVTQDKVMKILSLRREGFPLLIIDISNPRNVDPSITSIHGVMLKDLEGLRELAEEKAIERQGEIPLVEKIIEEELIQINRAFKRRKVEPVITGIFHKAEEMRMAELIKASKMLKGISGEQWKIIDDLTYELVERVLGPPIMNLRRIAMNGDKELISIIKELFNYDLGKKGER